MNTTLTITIIATIALASIIIYIKLVHDPIPTRIHKALKTELQRLFMEHSEDAKRFRVALLYHLPKNSQETAKQTMLEEAEHWKPDTITPAPKNHHIPNSIIYSGRLYKLYTEVTIKNNKIAEVLIEVD